MVTFRPFDPTDPTFKENEEVIGYNPSWISEDYNPAGTCVCFYQQGFPGYWVISKWCGYCDEYHTRYSHEAVTELGEAMESQPYIDGPTHWINKPTVNTIQNDGQTDY